MTKGEKEKTIEKLKLKIKRKVILDKYKELIDKIYSEQNQFNQSNQKIANQP